MKKLSHATTILIAVILVGIFATSRHAESQENEAEVILKTMSEYIGKQEVVQLTFDSGIEIITPELEKIQFTSSGKALLNRPYKLQAHRLSGHADVSLYYNGKTVFIHEKNSNGFVKYDAAGSVDQLLGSMSAGQGIALPGADLLLTNVYDILMKDVIEAKYIGRGIIDDRECDHLAFRNFDTDWQLWVEAGNNPVPCKMIITSKTMNSAPQYTLYIKSWETGGPVDDDSFSFTPPIGAKELSIDALIGFDELPPEVTQGESL